MRYGGFLATAAFALIAARPAPGSEIAERREIAKSPERVETTRSRPKDFGTQDYTVTVVPGIAFYPAGSTELYATSGSLGRFGELNTVQNFYAPVDIPRGAVIDYIGLNSQTDSPGGLGVAMYRRFPGSTIQTVGTFSSTVHSWGTDYNANPLDYAAFDQRGAYILHVQQGSFPTIQFLGHVEVWWRRQVGLSGDPTFNDVPVSHPFFQFVEALANSGITAGCGGGNFCPDNPLTRGQMAVFLAKALGLHWGVSGPPQVRTPAGPDVD